MMYFWLETVKSVSKADALSVGSQQKKNEFLVAFYINVIKWDVK